MGICGSKQNESDATGSTRNPLIDKKKGTDKENDQKEDEKFKQPGVCYLKRTGTLTEDLKELQKQYPQFEELMPRQWQNIAKYDISEAENNKNVMTIMQFNMLADGLTGAYLTQETEKTFLGVDKPCLEFTYRGLRLLEEMTRFDPDIICLEECDTIEFFMEYLSPMGYVSEFQEKSTSPIQEVIKEIAAERKGAKPKMPNDGVAIIYKKDKFEICGNVEKIDMKKNKEKVFGLAVPLRCKQSSSMAEFLMVCTHLKSTKDKSGEELRERQIRLLLSQLIKNGKNLPIIISADLNANPVVNKSGYDPLCYNALTGKSGLGFQSCYQIALGAEPEYTTWKLREKGTDKHVLDYIFINDNKWKVVGYLEIPKASNDVKSLIPSWSYPSDHFSIMVKLIWD